MRKPCRCELSLLRKPSQRDRRLYKERRSIMKHSGAEYVSFGAQASVFVVLQRVCFGHQMKQMFL